MYENEENIIAKAKEFLKNPNTQKDELLKELSEVVEAFETLLTDTKFMAKVSDRLQNKLSNANLELQEAKQNLELKVEQRTSDLLKAYQDLMYSHEELDTFVYRASHDLRGPIARLTGLTTVAFMELQEERALNYLKMFKETADLMDSVTLRLLMVHQLKNAEITPSEFKISTILSKYPAIFINYPEISKIEWKFLGNTSTVIFSDIEKWEILLTNLLENALQHVHIEERNQPFIHLSVDVKENGTDLVLMRNGMALKDKQIQNLFNLFFRTNHHPRHTGMELYTAQIAAHRLSGNVKFISSTEKVTVFQVHIPHSKREILLN
jgi:light-regulated signal transduction histidine kinase (bacteriophytochrome)